MKDKTITLTEAEWQVMDVLWSCESVTGREASDIMEEKMGWSRSTTLTLLGRLVSKGAVSELKGGKTKLFVPKIKKDEAQLVETENFLKRVYNGSLSLMVSSLTQKQALSKEEIEELLELLKGSSADNS